MLLLPTQTAATLTRATCPAANSHMPTMLANDSHVGKMRGMNPLSLRPESERRADAMNHFSCFAQLGVDHEVTRHSSLSDGVL